MNALFRKVTATPGDTLRSVSRSHVGLVRAINEDRVFNCPDAGVWAIVDGMGGHRGGDVAAQIVIDTLRDLVRDNTAPDFSAVLAAVHDANRRILDHNRDARQSAGATIVLALADGAHVRIAWAGDSRAYRLNGDHATLLTRDHSVVQELVDAGLLTDEAAQNHPQANVVTRALGVAESLEIESLSATIGDDERLLLCSDGLSRKFLPEMVPCAADLDALADRLIADALSSDGSDNVSLALIEGLST